MKKPVLALLMATSLLVAPLASPPAGAQQVVDVNPQTSSTDVSADTSISGQFQTRNGNGVDPSSVRIFVNDRDVSSRSTITRSFFTYRPDQPFAPGPVRVRVEYQDQAGEQQTTSWTFTVQAQQSVRISSVTHNAISSLNTGETFRVTVNGTPGAEATVVLVEGQTVREFPARETSSGVYTANLYVERGDRSPGSAVVARLRRQNQTVYAAASQPAIFNASGGSSGTAPGSSTPGNGTTPAPDTTLRPRFTSHRTGDRVGSQGFTLEGETSPNATVAVSVTAGASVLGVDLGGQSLVNEEVTADRNGRFTVEVPALSLAIPGLQYRVRATASDGSRTSPATEITLRQ